MKLAIASISVSCPPALEKLEQDRSPHRALLRFASGENVRFERVFSWLDVNLRSGAFANSVATELDSWDSVRKQFNWPDNHVTPRTFAGLAVVGDRISAPVGETGAGFGDEQLTTRRRRPSRSTRCAGTPSPSRPANRVVPDLAIVRFPYPMPAGSDAEDTADGSETV